MKQRTRLWLVIVVVLFGTCITMMQFVAMPAAAINRRNDAVWINRGGGNNSTGSDGLRARFNAPEQVVYANKSHLCCTSDTGNWGWGVAIGDISISTGFGLSADTWTSVDVMAWSGSVSFESDNNQQTTGDAYVLIRYRKVTATVPDGTEDEPNRTRDIYYTFDREIFYTFPNNYYTEKITAIIPNENTVDVRIYKGGQVAPGQSRQTVAYQFDAPYRSVGEIGDTGGYAVGIRDVPGSQMSATYVGNPDDVASYWAGMAFRDYVAPNPHPGGINAYWGIGTEPGVYQIRSEQYVLPQSTVIDAQFSHELITSTDDEAAILVTTTNYHATVDQTGVGFRFTIPSNTTLGAPVTSSCGGTVTTASTSVLVTGMTVPAKHQCVLTVPVSATTVGDVPLSSANVSEVTNATNMLRTRAMRVTLGTATTVATTVPATPTLTYTATATDTATATNTPTATIDTISTKTLTPTASRTFTPSRTPSPTKTFTPSRIPSSSRTPSNTRLRSPTTYRSPTFTASNTPTITNTATPQRSPTNTRTFTASRTMTPTANPYALRKVAIGNLYMLGVLHNNTLVAWGKNQAEFQESMIPTIYKELLFKDVAAAMATSYILTYDGRLFAWGQNDFGETNIPANARTGIASIGAGGRFGLAVRNDGTVAAWGNNDSGQTNVPSGLTGVVAIDGGDTHVVALKRDGTVVAWGGNLSGQAKVPSGLSGVIAISAGKDHSLALLNTGQIVGWGNNSKGQITIPSSATNIVSIAAGRDCSLAVRADGALLTWGIKDYANFPVSTINNAFTVTSDNQNSVVGLRDGGILIGGTNLSGVYNTRTFTRTPIITHTPSRTLTVSHTITPTFTRSLTPSNTPTLTPTPTRTATKTRTSSRTLTHTRSRTQTATRTVTPTRSVTPTR